MMAEKKKKPQEKDASASGSTRSRRDEAEKELTRSTKISPELARQTPEELIHELRVHQIEIEMQAEELIRAHLALEESRDKYLDLYEFAPIGYLTLTDTALIADVNLTGATLLGVERSSLVRARFRKFIAPHDVDAWDQYFMSVLQHEKTPPVTLLLKRGDDSVFPARLESIRFHGKSDGTTIVRVAISDITDIRQAEEALRKERDFANSIVGMAQAIILILDTGGHIVYFNHYLEEIAGYILEEVKGKDWFKTFLPSHTRETTRSLFRKAIGGIKTRGNVNDIITKDGRERLIEWYDTTIKGADGNIEGLLAIGQDVTDKKKAEEALRKSEEKFHNVFDWANDAILLHTLTTDKAPGRFIDVNLVACRMLGYNRKELLAMGPPDIVPPEFHPQLVDIIQQAQTTDTFLFETWFQRKDSTTFPVESSGHLVNYEGEKIWISHIRDITERKRVEEEIQRLLAHVSQEKEKLSSLINSITDEVWFADSEGRFTLANPTARREFCLDSANETNVETIAKNLEVLRPDGSPRPVDEAPPLRALAGNVVRFQEEIVRTPATGELRYRQVSAAPVHDDEGAIIGAISVVRDITDLKKAEDALRESEDKFRSLFEHMAAGSCVDEVIYEGGKAVDYRVLDINSAFERILGVSRSQVIGVLASQIYGTSNPPFLDIYSKVAETGEPAMFEAWFEPGKKYLQITASSPAKGRFSTVFTDITNRKQAEGELKRSFERFKMVMDGLDALVYVVDMKTFELLFINKYGKNIWGEIEGQTCWKTIQSGQPGPCPFCTNDKLVDSNGNPTGVYHWEFQNTVTRKWYDCRDSAIRWLDGRLVRLEIATDITERKNTADMFALTARKLTLMNDMTYQFIQNKVTAMRGYAELSKDVKTKAERLSFIEKEDHILADIHHLIKNTREYQEIGSIEPRWIPLEPSIRIATSLVSPNPDISIEITLHGLELYFDPLIEKVFFNLIDNAVKYGKTLTRIRFSCEKRPDGLILICEDDGVGISPNVKAHLFDRSVGENIRFGLFFIRECLDLAGITIAETGEPGKGARFEITVPKGMYRFSNTGEK